MAVASTFLYCYLFFSFLDLFHAKTIQYPWKGIPFFTIRPPQHKMMFSKAGKKKKRKMIFGSWNVRPPKRIALNEKIAFFHLLLINFTREILVAFSPVLAPFFLYSSFISSWFLCFVVKFQRMLPMCDRNVLGLWLGERWKRFLTNFLDAKKSGAIN